MRVLVTGATGFVGRHVVQELLDRGHSVVAAARDAQRADQMPWRQYVSFVACDIHQQPDLVADQAQKPDALIHLAWPGLPRYEEPFHVDENLPGALRFLRASVEAGVPHLLVAGTCLEYGMQFGPLLENAQTLPTTSYGLAKDTLRKALQQLQSRERFAFQWARLFYVYGPGQNPNSLLSQLDRAIDANEPVFRMSPGDQLRDYLKIGDVARNFVRLLEHPDCQGVINCSSGRPISVRDLVESRCRERGSNIVLERGFYTYPAYEPLAFWGVADKLASLPQPKAGDGDAVRSS